MRSILNVEYSLADKMMSQLGDVTMRKILGAVLSQETEGNKEGSFELSFDAAM